jgi:hypothetical protein
VTNPLFCVGLWQKKSFGYKIPDNHFKENTPSNPFTTLGLFSYRD